jgi:hypothetical protein
MKDLIFEFDLIKKYQVDMGNLKDRIRGRRNKAWSPWKDLTTEALEYHQMMIPDLMTKRNKIIHNGHSEQR